MIEIGKRYFDGEAHKRLRLTSDEDLKKYGYVIIRYRKSVITRYNHDGTIRSGAINNYERKGKIIDVKRDDYSLGEIMNIGFMETVESNGINRVIHLMFNNDSKFEIIFYEFLGQYTFLKLQGHDVFE